jgi:hypothetical protein
MGIKPIKNFEKGVQKHEKIIIFLIFLGILFFLVYTSFSDNLPFVKKIMTGEFIKDNFNKNNISDKNIRFESELTIPELSFDGKFEKIEMSGSSNSFLYVGGQKFELGKIRNNFFVFKNFDGEISFDGEKITEFKGKVSDVTINGVLVTPVKNTTKISLEEGFNYQFLEINNGVSIKEITYITSGLIKLNNGEQVFNINNNEITIKDFYGNIIIDKEKFNADGYIGELSIVGESNINIQS